MHGNACAHPDKCSEEDTRIVVMIEAGDWESIIGNDDKQVVTDYANG